MAIAYRNDSSARVFISYARADGEGYAKYLHDKLNAEGITSWWDREDLRRTNNWWRKIDEALESVEYLVAVLTPKILNSETCRKEWQWARRKGRCIVPVKAGMSFETPTVPRWLKRGHAYQALALDQAIPSPGSEWQKLVNDLNTTPKVEKVPFMAGDLPEDFVARPEEFNKLLALVIDPERSEPLAITAALRGAGGYGKTTLAKALCHDLRVQEAFDDGILWATLGVKAENLTGKIRDCIQALSGERPDFAGEREAAAKLAELLDSRDVLLVVDDVWKRSHLEPFLQGGNRCARLVTTRISDVLPKSARKQNVDAMKDREAAELLSAGLGDGDSKQFVDLARQLGEWPLLLKLVNRYLFDRAETGQPVADAIRFVSGKLKRQGITAFDPEDADAVAKTVSVSLDLLDPHTQVPRLFELGIFPEDEDIPIDIIASLWQQTGGIDEITTEELCERFFKLSLVLELNLGKRTLRLHDAFRSYFHSRLSDNRVVHDQLLKSWTDPYALPNAYAWKWYGYHVSNSSQLERLRALLTDFKWLNAKLNATEVNNLLAEFKYAANVDSLRLIESAVRLSAHILAKDKSQVASQLLGRLPGSSNDAGDAIRAEALGYTDTTWLMLIRLFQQTPIDYVTHDRKL